MESAFDSGDSIAFVEWWERGASIVPARRFEVVIDGAGEGPRSILVREPA